MRKKRKPKWTNPSGTKTYYAWRSMRQRCIDTTHPAYHNYGGRGITVDPSWVNNYDQFFVDMGECPAGRSLEREDNNKGYTKSNCRWATGEEQHNNERRNINVTVNGETLTATQWARKLGVNPNTMIKRLERMTPERAVSMSYKRDIQGYAKLAEDRCVSDSTMVTNCTVK